MFSAGEHEDPVIAKQLQALLVADFPHRQDECLLSSENELAVSTFTFLVLPGTHLDNGKDQVAWDGKQVNV